MLLAAFFGVGVVAYLAKLANSRDGSFAALLPAIHFAALAAVLASVPFVVQSPYLGYSDAGRSLDVPQFAFLAFTNAYFVAFAIAGIYAGVSKKDSFTVNVSLAAITVFVFAKYFDWFFDMMDRALFFIF